MSDTKNWHVTLELAYEVREMSGARVCVMSHLKGKYGLGGRRDPSEVEANAWLIAAAPDLLAALKFYMPIIKILMPEIDPLLGDAAIAKAEPTL
jgi:hypothetical protein